MKQPPDFDIAHLFDETGHDVTLSSEASSSEYAEPNKILEEVSSSELSQIQNDLVEQGCLEQAQMAIQKWLTTQGTRDVTYLPRLELARILLWRSQLTKARELTESLVRERLTDSWPKSLLGQIEVQLGNYDAAYTLFTSALILDSGNHEAQTFLKGDAYDDYEHVRKLLSYGSLLMRGKIKAAILCDAMEFKRRSVAKTNRGPLSQAFFNRANLAIDCAELGHTIDAPWALASKKKYDKIVFYTSDALGDSILSTTVAWVLLNYFHQFPQFKCPIEIVSPYHKLLQGLEGLPNQDIRVRDMDQKEDFKKTEYLAKDIEKQSKNTLLISGIDSSFLNESLKTDINQDRPLLIDFHIDRFSRGLESWQTTVGTEEHILSYPARLYRMMEILFGCRLLADPNSFSLRLPTPSWIEDRRDPLLTQYRLSEVKFVAVIECVSKQSKRFSRTRLLQLMKMLVNIPAMKEWKVLFCAEPDPNASLVKSLEELPDEVKSRIVIANENLENITCLLSQSQAAISVDTGLAHLTASFGIPTLIIYTMADPYLWTTGKEYVTPLSASQAITAHRNLTPVNMQKWEMARPIIDDMMSEELFGMEIRNFIHLHFR